jgi:hypothetical protein
MADRRGIWLSVTDRATGAKRGGHIPWAVAEAQLSPHVQEALFT